MKLRPIYNVYIVFFYELCMLKTINRRRMEFSAAQIASFIGGTVDGNGDAKVSTFAKIEEATPGTLTFLANPKYTEHIYTTGASVVLVANDFTPEHEIKATLIRVANPYETLARLMQTVAAATTQLPTGIEQPCFVAEGVEVADDCYIGAFAYVGKGVKLGKGVKIYPQVYVGDNVIIGDNTILYAGCKIYAKCKIGSRCIIHSGAVIGADGFGFAPEPDGSYTKIPQMGIVEICDDVEVGANTCIDRATMGETRVEKGVKLDNLIQLAHNTQVGANTVMASQVGVAGSTKIGGNCMIGGQVGFAGHITVGNRVQIGAQSGIPNNVADGSTLMGYPAVPARDFARQAAQMRRLGQLFDDVKALKKEIKQQ